MTRRTCAQCGKSFLQGIGPLPVRLGKLRLGSVCSPPCAERLRLKAAETPRLPTTILVARVVLALQAGPVTANDLAFRLEVPARTIRRILRSLARGGVFDQNPTQGASEAK